MPLANIPRLNNPNICHLLRCTPEELSQLKNSFKSELQAQWAGGMPFLGQLVSESDPDGSIRDELWTAVAGKNTLLGRLLSGRRYPLGTLPAGFADGLRMAKDKIFADINTAVRRTPHIRPRRRRRAGSPPSRSSSQSRTSSQVPVPTNKRLRRREPSNHGAHDPEIRQRHDDELENRAPGSPARVSRSPSVIFLSDGDAEVEPGSKEVVQGGSARSPTTSPTPAEIPQLGRPTVNLPQAIHRIRELEAHMSMLEQSIRQQNSSIENRIMQQVRSMLADRDRTIERLRWYLEGDA